MDDEARDGPDHVPLEDRSDGEPPDGTPERPGAADGLRRHRERSPSPPAWRYFEVLVAEEQDWFDRMVTYVAAVHRVDRGDLYQEVALGLRTADPLSLGREGWRTWLRQRTWWKAQDIRRSRRGGRTAYHDPEHLGRLAAERQRAGLAGDPTAHQREWIAPDDTLRRLRRLGLSHDQALLLQLTMFDPDLTLKDIADRLGDSYAAVRQRQVRAMRAARAGFGLQPDEEAALRAVWTHSSGADAARELGIDESELRRRYERATTKIHRLLDDEG